MVQWVHDEAKEDRILGAASEISTRQKWKGSQLQAIFEKYGVSEDWKLEVLKYAKRFRAERYSEKGVYQPVIPRPCTAQETLKVLGSYEQYPKTGPNSWKYYAALSAVRVLAHVHSNSNVEGSEPSAKPSVPRASDYVKEDQIQKVLRKAGDPPLKSILARIIVSYYGEDIHLFDLISDMEGVSSQANVRRIVKQLEDKQIIKCKNKVITWE